MPRSVQQAYKYGRHILKPRGVSKTIYILADPEGVFQGSENFAKIGCPLHVIKIKHFESKTPL
jgi:hypothetical protein